MNTRSIGIAIALVVGIGLVLFASAVLVGLLGHPASNAAPTAGARLAGGDPCGYSAFLPSVKNGPAPVGAAPTGAGAGATPGAVPNFSHIYILVMENKEYSTVIGNASAPYVNCLAANFGLATNYTGVTHPSEPNYLALFSGSTQGVSDDGVYHLVGQNLADQLEAHGKTWKVFAQNYPLNCSQAASASGGPDDPAGTYARKHNPAISFTNISASPARCANITDFAHFDPAAADFELIIPNLCNDTHDCAVATGDAFLKGFVPKILNSSAWNQGGVLFITYDEGITNTGGGGVVVTAVISNAVPQGATSAVAHNHYSLLRTVEDAWGLGTMNQSAAANNLGEFFP